MEDIGRGRGGAALRDRAAHEPLVGAGRPARERDRLAGGGVLRRRGLGDARRGGEAPHREPRRAGRRAPALRTPAARPATASWRSSACARSSSPRSRSSARGGPPSPPPPRGTGAWSRRSDAARPSAPAGARQAGLGRHPAQPAAGAPARADSGATGRRRPRRPPGRPARGVVAGGVAGSVGPTARGPGAVVRDRRGDRWSRWSRSRCRSVSVSVPDEPPRLSGVVWHAKVRRVAARLVVAPAAECVGDQDDQQDHEHRAAHGRDAAAPVDGLLVGTPRRSPATRGTRAGIESACGRILHDGRRYQLDGPRSRRGALRVRRNAGP